MDVGRGQLADVVATDPRVVEGTRAPTSVLFCRTTQWVARSIWIVGRPVSFPSATSGPCCPHLTSGQVIALGQATVQKRVRRRWTPGGPESSLRAAAVDGVVQAAPGP